MYLFFSLTSNFLNLLCFQAWRIWQMQMAPVCGHFPTNYWHIFHVCRCYKFFKRDNAKFSHCYVILENLNARIITVFYRILLLNILAIEMRCRVALLFFVFSRVHATLHPALSVGRSVGLSVGLSHFTFFINFFSLSHFMSF